MQSFVDLIEVGHCGEGLSDLGSEDRGVSCKGSPVGVWSEVQWGVVVSRQDPEVWDL